VYYVPGSTSDKVVSVFVRFFIAHLLYQGW
jgi:hypothetical protein